MFSGCPSSFQEGLHLEIPAATGRGLQEVFGAFKDPSLLGSTVAGACGGETHVERDERQAAVRILP